MVTPPQLINISPAQCLELEAQSPGNHEYLDGQLIFHRGLCRGAKFDDYPQIESLREYVLISTHRQRIDCFRRSQTGLWVLRSYGGADSPFQLESLDVESPIQLLYEAVAITPRSEDLDHLDHLDQ